MESVINILNELKKDEREHKNEMIELIKHYFVNGNIGSGIGELYEYNISEMLKTSGYRRFPLEVDGAPTVKFGGKNLFSGKQVGEVDSLVQGNAETWKQLIEMCSFNQLRKNESLSEHILVIEAKVSHNEAINKMMKHDEVDNMYWLLRNSNTTLSHNVLFINGGEKSKEWVMNGGSSNIRSEKLVWDALASANVSLFYRASLSQEWVIDLTNRIEKLELNEIVLKERLDKQETDIKEMKIMIDDLKRRE